MHRFALLILLLLFFTTSLSARTEMQWRVLSRLYVNAYAALGQVSGGFDFGLNQYGGTGIYFGVNEVF